MEGNNKILRNTRQSQDIIRNIFYAVSISTTTGFTNSNYYSYVFINDEDPWDDKTGEFDTASSDVTKVGNGSRRPGREPIKVPAVGRKPKHITSAESVKKGNTVFFKQEFISKKIHQINILQCRIFTKCKKTVNNKHIRKTHCKRSPVLDDASDSSTNSEKTFDSSSTNSLPSLEINMNGVKDKWQHPNADKLSCTTVDVGGESLLNIVWKKMSVFIYPSS